MEHKHLERMREIASGDDTSDPLENYECDIARAVVYLLEKRIENLALQSAQSNEFNALKRRVEELERQQNLR